jgi:hypothetical protein
VPGAVCISGEWYYNDSLVITDVITIDEPVTIRANFTLDQNGQLVVLVGPAEHGLVVVEGCAYLYGSVVLNFTRAPEDGEVIEFLRAACVQNTSTTRVEATGDIPECEEAHAEQLSAGQVVVRVTSQCDSSSKRKLLIIVGSVLGGVLLLLLLLAIVVFSVRRYRESRFWSNLIWSPERGRQVIEGNYLMLDEHS